MVKSVVGDETQLQSAEERLSRSSIKAEVGVIVGKLNPHLDRGFAYDLIPTPPTDGGGSACSLKSDSIGRDDRKKVTKSGKPSAEAVPSFLIDVDWVSEHARQVSRMLLGGMNVIGIYVWSSEATYKATSATVLSQTIRAVAQAAPSFKSETNERLLIHISYSPKRWACRNFVISSSEMRPCDFKMSRLIASLQTFRCMYSFELRIPIYQNMTSTSSTFKNLLCSGISQHAKELQSARALLDGELVGDNQQVASGDLHNVELLLPFKISSQMEACSSDKVAGLVVFKGVVSASSYLNPKEFTSQAIYDIKNDIINSLNSRLDIMIDGAEENLDTYLVDSGKESYKIESIKPIHEVLHKLKKPLVLIFPRRVLVPWISDVFICDYLLPSETFEDLKDRCREIMLMEAPSDSSALLEVETEAAPITSSFWDVVRGNPKSYNGELKNRNLSSEESSSKKSISFNSGVAVALFVLFLAVLIGVAITIFSPVQALL